MRRHAYTQSRLKILRQIETSGQRGGAFDWLPIPGLFLKTEYRYSQYGGNGVNVPLSGSIGGVPVTNLLALNSQQATQFVSTELVYRFNWLGR